MARKKYAAVYFYTIETSIYMQHRKLTICESLKNKDLWVLGSSDGKISLSRLHKHTEITKAELDDILDELEREDEIIIGTGRRKIVLLKT